MEHRKEVDGKTVAMFDREEVDEIVIAQVKHGSKFLYMTRQETVY